MERIPFGLSLLVLLTVLCGCMSHHPAPQTVIDRIGPGDSTEQVRQTLVAAGFRYTGTVEHGEFQYRTRNPDGTSGTGHLSRVTFLEFDRRDSDHPLGLVYTSHRIAVILDDRGEVVDVKHHYDMTGV